jgi:hypothetical protein
VGKVEAAVGVFGILMIDDGPHNHQTERGGVARCFWGSLYSALVIL